MHGFDNRLPLAVGLWAITLVGAGDFSAGRASGGEPEAWKVEVLRGPLRAFCIDFNWEITRGKDWKKSFAKPGRWADADPAEHVAWYESLGVNTIQTFVLSCNGYAWYKGGPVPEQPGLKHDFLTDMVRLGHQKHMLVLGYYCVGANVLWCQEHPDHGPAFDASLQGIPLTREYVDYLCQSLQDALRRTGMDGFMLDVFKNRTSKDGKWLACEKAMYGELMGKPFPGDDKVTKRERAEFDERAVERCWRRLRDTARRVKPDCILWVNDLKYAGLEGVDWLLNESPDPQELVKRKKQLAGTRVRLIQDVAGWASHDAFRVLSDPMSQGWDIYGYAAPYDNSLPVSIHKCLGQPLESFVVTDRMSANDRNIAVMARYFLGKPLSYVSD